MSSSSEEKASAAAASLAPQATFPRAPAAAAADAPAAPDITPAANATAIATGDAGANATADAGATATADAGATATADAGATATADAGAGGASREAATGGAVCGAAESTDQKGLRKSEEERSSSFGSEKSGRSSSSIKREEANDVRSSVDRGDSSNREEESSSKKASGDSSNMIACEGCGLLVKPVLACPSCVKLRIKHSYFCNQECFKANWKRHKEVHAVMQQLLVQQEKCARAAAEEKDRAAATQLQKPMRQAVEWFKPFDARDPSTWEGDIYLPRFLNFRFTGPLRPWRTRQARRKIPPGVHTPDYAETGTPYSEEAERGRAGKIHVHTEDEIQRVRAACALGREALDYAHKLVQPGISTEEIDEKVHEFIVSRGAYPSPLNYCGFPKSCCTSVNEVICHGIPNMRPLEKGDLLNIDITVYYRGMHGDLNETYVVGGETDEESKRLLQGAYLCLAEAIKRCRPGVMYRHVGQFVSEVAEKYRLSVVRSYCGHGIGALFHTRPNVPHYANNKAPATMKPGHIFTIEPMLNLGKWNDVLWPDKWTACTADGKRSAQFEHTLLVTKTGVEVLTHRRSDSPPLDCDTKSFDFP